MFSPLIQWFFGDHVVWQERSRTHHRHGRPAQVRSSTHDLQSLLLKHLLSTEVTEKRMHNLRAIPEDFILLQMFEMIQYLERFTINKVTLENDMFYPAKHV